MLLKYNVNLYESNGFILMNLIGLIWKLNESKNVLNSVPQFLQSGHYYSSAQFEGAQRKERVAGNNSFSLPIKWIQFHWGKWKIKRRN